MILSFEFPDYCFKCPLMELAVDNDSCIEVADIDEEGSTISIPLVYCAHIAACETWHNILEKNQEGEEK